MSKKVIDHQKRVYSNIIEMLSNEDNPTPLVQLQKVIPFKKSKVYAKLEWYNPFGAVKDRIASNMILEAEEDGSLKNNKNLVEPTSGNTGFALSMLANVKGLNLTSPLSSMIPLEKRALLKFMGCNVIELEDTLCPAPGAPEGAIAKAMSLSQQPGSLMLDQYTNEANPRGHYKTTGPEIWRQTDGKVTHFISALGTCGTITGVGTFLKEKNSNIKVIGIHPEEGHDIPGVRSIRQLKQTKLFRPELYDEMIEVSNRDSFDMCLRINREESIIAGPSSGMAVAGALKFLQDEPEAVVVIIFPDNSFKYTSSFQRHFPELFKDTVGSSANPDSKNKKEELYNKLIELNRNALNTIELSEAVASREGEKSLFVDVRNSDQYSATHIEGAINIPNDELLFGDDRLPVEKDAAIITVCNKGNMSLQGLLVLKSLGYSNVRSLNGGTIGWDDAGYPVKKK
jgi:cysteine synthase/rhodanese-related sulfurtransferase